MKQFLILATCVGLLLFLVGPFREGLGRFLSSFEQPATPRTTESPRTGEGEDIHEAIQEYRLRSAKRVKQVQRALKQAGFDPGSIDGLIGHRTHTALIAFQKAHDMEPDGVLGVKTWEALRAYLPTVQATEVDTQ